MAEFVTRTIDNASHGITVKAAMEKLGLHDARDLLPGLEVRLLPHQAIGVNWMLDQERNTPHKGGILADDMGLGKTVQMIATMAMNQPGEGDTHRSTLIVVPAALLLQWKEEIESKTNGMFSVHIQHGREKIKSLPKLAEKDVVITTYHTLNSDFAVPSDVESSDEMDWIVTNGGLMARMKWFRVVLDEAQFIRNRSTRSSKAVAMLRAKYRWCLTGTPVTNTLADIYGLIRFGRFRPWNDWEDFNAYIAKVQLEDAPLAGLRAQEVLKPLLLRRTKDAELEGRPLLQLPEKHIELVTLEFSEEERELYDSFEKRAQIQINRFIRENTIVKKCVLILRMRQLCCHPHLILSLTEGFEDPTLLVGSDADKEIARANKLLGAQWVMEVCPLVASAFMARARAAQFDFGDEDDETEPTCPVCGDLFMNDSGRLLACGHEICNDCLDALGTAPIMHDGEFGLGDEQTNLRIEKEFEAAAAKGLRPCPTCKKMNDLRPTHVFRASAFEPAADEVRMAMQRAREARRRAAPGPPKRVVRRSEVEELIELSDSSDEDLPDISQLLAREGNKKGKGKGKRVVSDDSDAEKETRTDKGKGKGRSRDWDSDDDAPRKVSGDLLATWNRGDNNMEPSTKMLALIELLQEWEATGDKTIVFSQWTSMLDLVETLFARYGIRSLRYDGRMGREAREMVLAQFRKSGGPRVILISIKCGGVGLNLVSANRIINLDLSWNYASESQAYDRVHRLGQEKEVFVKRLVVSNTIEERMLQLQETKVGLAEAALGEGTGVKLHKLSVKELKDVRVASFSCSYLRHIGPCSRHILIFSSHCFPSHPCSFSYIAIPLSSVLVFSPSDTCFLCGDHADDPNLLAVRHEQEPQQ
ncbi:SNF2 family N-terminal domain-containing protein [Sparassis latifolia]